MAQEIPLLYGWGAAPAQRLYKSNEVVGINYTNQAVAHKQTGIHTYPENQPGYVGSSSAYTSNVPTSAFTTVASP
jgi:hypothetical protein